jgi:acetyl-CoA carboxylase alpha subunit
MVQNETGMFVMPYKKLDNSKTDMDEELVNKIKEISKLRKSISTNQLKNIESFKFDRLPPNPMRSAFIDQYCTEVEKLNKIS